MKKRISFLLAAVLLLATLIPALPIFAADETATITDTFNANDENPKISTKNDYINFFNTVWESSNGFANKTVTLLQDITLNDTTDPDWYTKEGVYKLPVSNKWAFFMGTFDGNGHTIRGAIADGAWGLSGSAIEGICGIFPSVRNGGTIRNLNVDGFYVRSTNTTMGWTFGRAGIGGLIGYAQNDVTIDNCTLKNGVVTAVANGKGSIGGLIGTYFKGNDTLKTLSITDTVVSNVRLDNAGTLCENLGGLCGIIVNQGGTGANGATLDFSGSVIQPDGSMDAENPLKPVGLWANQGGTVKWAILNRATGNATISDNWVWLNEGTKTSYPDMADAVFGKNNDVYCNGQIINSGCYGASAIPTVKLVGVQPATDGSNDLRFVGMIKKVDLDLITALGFEITVGDKTVGTDAIKCTWLYESIKENGKDKAAPEGYYFFTFVVTDVADGTAFTVKACTTVDGKVCATTAGAYTHTRAAS